MYISSAAIKLKLNNLQVLESFACLYNLHTNYPSFCLHRKVFYCDLSVLVILILNETDQGKQTQVWHKDLHLVPK